MTSSPLLECACSPIVAPYLTAPHDAQAGLGGSAQPMQKSEGGPGRNLATRSAPGHLSPVKPLTVTPLASVPASLGADA